MRSDFDRAAALVTRRLHLRTYALLKPPFLSEGESIEHAVQTIRHAFEMSASTVSLEACTVQDHTLTHYLDRLGLYRPAWLWSIVEVIRRTAHLGKTVVGLFQFYPAPDRVPGNCRRCSERVMQAIRRYNRTFEVDALAGLQCDCQVEWRKSLGDASPTTEQRLEALERALALVERERAALAERVTVRARPRCASVPPDFGRAVAAVT